MYNLDSTADDTNRADPQRGIGNYCYCDVDRTTHRIRKDEKELANRVL